MAMNPENPFCLETHDRAILMSSTRFDTDYEHLIGLEGVLGDFGNTLAEFFVFNNGEEERRVVAIRDLIPSENANNAVFKPLMKGYSS